MSAFVMQAVLSAANLAGAIVGPFPIFNAFVAGACACGAMYSAIRAHDEAHP